MGKWICLFILFQLFVTPCRYFNTRRRAPLFQNRLCSIRTVCSLTGWGLNGLKYLQQVKRSVSISQTPKAIDRLTQISLVLMEVCKEDKQNNCKMSIGTVSHRLIANYYCCYFWPDPAIELRTFQSSVVGLLRENSNLMQYDKVGTLLAFKLWE